MSPSGPANPGEHSRRGSGHQPPRVTVTATITTIAGDPLLLMEIGLFAGWFGGAGACEFEIARKVAIAQFRFKAPSAKSAALEVGRRLPRPTAGTALAIVARNADGHERPVVFTTEGWPEELPDAPGADEAIYRWTADDPNVWEVL